MKAKAYHFRLFMKGTFRVSYGAYKYRDALIVELEEAGLKGFGEATAVQYYGKSIEDFANAFTKVKPFLMENTFANPEELWHAVAPKLKENPFVLCAIDCAAHDLFAKKSEQPLNKILGSDKKNFTKTGITISIASVEETIEKIKAYDWPVYKIKMGEQIEKSFLDDIASVTNAQLRIDANAAWSKENAIGFLELLKNYRVEMVEQPLAVDKINNLFNLFCLWPILPNKLKT